MSAEQDIALLKAYADGGPETSELRRAVKATLVELARTRSQLTKACADRIAYNTRLQQLLRERRS